MEFALDPGAVGKSLRWFDGQQPSAVWRPIDSTRPYYLQVPGCYTADGMPYVGHMWYRCELDVPAVPAGRQVRLYSPAVSCEAWVWVNGQYAGYRKYLEAYIRPNELDLDVTALIKPGQKNSVSVWVSTGVNRTQAPEGFAGRILLFAPK